MYSGILFNRIPLFVQRNPVQQEKTLKQELLGCKQLLRRTEIERDKARKERDAEVKKREKAAKERHEATRKWVWAARIAISLALTLGFFLLISLAFREEKNVLANVDCYWPVLLTEQSGESGPNMINNFRTVVTYDGDDSLLAMKSDSTYTLNYYVLDYNYGPYDADIRLRVSSALEAGKAGFATLAIDMGDGDVDFVKMTLGSSKDLSISSVNVKQSYYIEAKTDDGERIEQYLAEHGVNEDLDSLFSERLWHFVVEIKTADPEYITTFNTGDMSYSKTVLFCLGFSMFCAVFLTFLFTDNWGDKYEDKDENEDFDDLFYSGEVDEETFVAEIEAYLRDYYDYDDTSKVTAEKEKEAET